MRDFLDAWAEQLEREYPLAFRLIPREWVDSRIALSITPRPDSLVRQWFHITRTTLQADLEPPVVSPLVRRGFFVLEWGVIRGPGATHVPR